jgi:hypothetical protein
MSYTSDAQSFIAVTSLDDAQCCCVELTADPQTGEQGIQVAQGGQIPICGILQDKPLKGDPACVQVRGVTKGVLAPWTSAATGGLLEVATDGSGYLRPKTTGLAVARLLGRAVNTLTDPAVVEIQLLSGL